MADKKVFIGGVRLFPAKQGAPTWVVANGVISLDDLAKFVKEQKELKENITEYQGKPQIKFQITKSDRDGSMSMSVDTYKGGAGQSKTNAQTNNRPASNVDEESLPF